MAQCLSFYTYCSSLGVGCYLYTDIKRTTTVSAGWVSDGTTNWSINSSGMITGVASCNVSPNWVLAFGSYTCVGCDKHYVEVDNNPYSPTYGNTRTGGVAESNSTYCGGCCGQSTAANWTIIFGSYGCSGCNKYYMEYDANSCSPTYNQQRLSSALAEGNSTYCGGCCGQSTAANWTVVFGQYQCSGCDKYYVEQDLNSCSATYNQTRQGSLAESNSTFCGCGQLPCYQFYVYDYGSIQYTDCYGNSYYNYFNAGEYFCANTVNYGAAYSIGDCLVYQP